jgi:hypothetical protein
MARCLVVFLIVLLTAGCTSWSRIELPADLEPQPVGRSQVWVGAVPVEVEQLAFTADSARGPQRTSGTVLAWPRKGIDSVRVRRLDPGKLLLGVAALPVGLSMLFLIDEWTD